MRITQHSVATIEYTLTDDSGEVIDTSKGGDPLVYLHGVGGLIPGLEAELEGKQAGDAIKVRIAPENAYGERDDEMIVRVPRSQLPSGAALQIGMQFQASGPDGAQIVTLVKLEGDDAWLDANHPLAGVHLNFEVKIVEVRAATQEELSHGHVHGAGGHHHH